MIRGIATREPEAKGLDLVYFATSVKRVDEFLETRFPRTPAATWENYLQAYKATGITDSVRLRRIQEALEHREIGPISLHSKKRGDELIYLATLFNREMQPIPTEAAIGNISERLQGKRVLSLGDDTGSLSEVFASFGCEAYGIEADPAKISIARIGYFSEDRQPNTKVIYGDVWQLVLPDSNLRKMVAQRQYDAIISVDLFDEDSGGEEPADTLKGRIIEHAKQMQHVVKSPLREALSKILSKSYQDFVSLFICLINDLTANDGFQVHRGNMVRLGDKYVEPFLPEDLFGDLRVDYFDLPDAHFIKKIPS